MCAVLRSQDQTRAEDGCSPRGRRQHSLKAGWGVGRGVGHLPTSAFCVVTASPQVATKLALRPHALPSIFVCICALQTGGNMAKQNRRSWGQTVARMLTTLFPGVGPGASPALPQPHALQQKERTPPPPRNLLHWPLWPGHIWVPSP